MTKQTLNRYKEALEQKTFTKSMINAVCKMMNDQYRKHCVEKESLLQDIKRIVRTEHLDITSDQALFGIEWLNNYMLKKNGEPRQQKDNPFKKEHIEIMKNFSHFKLIGFKNFRKGYGWHRPVYRAFSKNGKCFDYVPNTPFNGSPVLYCSPVFSTKSPNRWSPSKKKKIVDTYTSELGIKRVARRVSHSLEKHASKNSLNSGGYGAYVKLNESVGVKVFIRKDGKRIAKTFKDREELVNSSVFDEAIQELELLQQAEHTGISPIPVDVIEIETKFGWVAGLVMEHCGERLDSWDDGLSDEIDELLLRLENEAGLQHNDMHHGNAVMNKQGEIKIIDFSPDYICKVA